METLKIFIAEIENHTNQKFDINKRKHFHLLGAKIQRQLDDRDRKLNLIASVLKSETEDSLYTSSKEYVRNRYND
jgi:alkylhydroperoxidase/carboxymuconolactone decarboxylase family protein YurZ